MTNSTIYDIQNCAGKTNICKTSNCDGEVDYSVIVRDGGVYFNLVAEDGYLIDKPVTQHNDIILAVNIRSQILINDIVNKTFGEDINKDIIVLMDQPGIFEEYGRWFFTSNIAYAQLTPWWLSLISFNLLVPDDKKLNIRMVPNLCPMQDKELKEAQIGLTWEAINDQFGDQEYAKTI